MTARIFLDDEKPLERMSETMSQDVLCLILHDTQATREIRPQVHSALFESRVLQDIASKAIAFFDQYGEAVRDHIDSVLSDVLEGDDAKKIKLYKRVLDQSFDAYPRLNKKYVVDHVGAWKLGQEAKIGTLTHVDLIEAGRIDEASALMIKTGQSIQAGLRAGGSDGVILTSGRNVVIKAVEWLWPRWLARGKLALIVGQSEAGKTTVTLSFAVTVTIGGEWPDMKRHSKPGNVLIWSAEDDVDDTLAPRLQAMGADMDRVFFVQGMKTKGESMPFDPATDLPELQRAAKNIPGGVDLLIVDPVVSVVTGNSNDMAQVRRGLQPLVDFAQSLHCAVIGISHVVKNSRGSSPKERVLGSGAFGHVPRIIMHAAERKDDQLSRRVLVLSKTSNSQPGGGFEYVIESTFLPPPNETVETSKLRWFADPLAGKAHQLLRDAEGTDADDQASVSTEKENEAVEFLKTILRDGRVNNKDVKKAAKAEDISESALQRALRPAGVIVRRVGSGPTMTSFWSLSDDVSRNARIE